MSERKWNDLIRDGRITRYPSSGPSEFFIVPVQPGEHEGVDIRNLFVSPPAHVLIDKFNPDYAHYFADVERKRDYYRLCGRTKDAYLYEYDHTDTIVTKDYLRINPELLP